MKFTLIALGFTVLTTSVFATSEIPSAAFEQGEDKPGGNATHHKRIDKNSFSHASANLKFDQELSFKVGNGFFRRLWVSSPASTQAADGLGPLFNSRGCQNCHIKDGRGHPPLENEITSESLLLRLSIPPQNQNDIDLLSQGKVLSIDDPVYGGQLQSFSVQGVVSEGNIAINHTPYNVFVSNGKSLVLQRPNYSITNLGYGALHEDIMISPRVAPQMIGLGLLEAISEKDILSLADEFDTNGDGISGRPNKVWSKETNSLALGRFGHKAGQSSINQQNQGAFSGDIGMSTPLFPSATGDCTEHQENCLLAPHGNSPHYENLEAHSEIIDLILFYTRNLAVPGRRNAKSEATLQGKQIFHSIGCAACHQPSFTTMELDGRPEHSNQLIWPYTDLLLHDMGEGLADKRPEGQASGTEWRTAPLWGIGLTETVNGHSRFLHDGRANGLHEAILWHGGEAAAARNHYIDLKQSEKELLLKFIESL